jgi:cystathionine gamma-synthase
MNEEKYPRTIAAANGLGDDEAFGAVVPPLHLSTTYLFRGFEKPGRFDYARTAHPLRNQLADTLAKLEGGAGAVVTASGMAAVDLVLSRLGMDDLVVAPHDCYAGTYRLLEQRAARRQFAVAFVDQNDRQALDAALARRPRLVLVETPSNPLMRIVDIADVAAKAKAVGAELAVDNTFLSPVLQNPIALGADFVIHSTTKYLNGHSDVVGGAVVTARRRDADDLAGWANITGIGGTAFDAYQTLRGVRTLFVRVERQQQSAMAIAEYLARHPRVAAIHYPGLRDHPGHARAKTQQRGFGAMLSFELRGGRAAARAFAEATRIFFLAESLGGVESLVAHPETMTHASMDATAQAKAGITPALLRLSIGLEDERDLIADLRQALDKVG